jgi:membrane protein required for beta-lactamase induction
MITVSLILIALAIEYFYDDIKKYRRNDIVIKSYSLFEQFFNDEKYSKDIKFLLFLVAILFFSMILVTLSYYLSSVLYYLLSLLLVLFSLRTNEYNREIEEFKIKLEFNKDSIDNKMLFSLCPNLKQTRAKSNINNLVIKNLFFNSMRNTFSVIFVFILLGAPAAMTYKIIDLMLYSDIFKINIQTKNNIKKYVYFIDYIPIRLTSYSLSIVSNYDRVIDKINNLKLSNNMYLSNIEYINQTGEAVYDASQKEIDQIIQIQNILSRALIAWLSIIFLLGITGFFI